MTADGTNAGSATLWDLFVDAARIYPDRPALWVDGCEVSYGELRSAASKIGAAIANVDDHAEAPTRQCGLLVERSITGYASVLAALSAGCAYVPLNPRFPAGRLLAMLEASDVAAIIIDSASMGPAKALITDSVRPLTIVLPDAAVPPDWALGRRRHSFICRGDIERQTALMARRWHEMDDGAYLLFTSGSTGVPKGVMIRHRNVMAYLASVTARYAPTPDDRFSQLFDFSFDLSVHDMFLCWSAGACLYPPPRAARIAPREFVEKHGLTIWFSVPSTAATMERLRMLDDGRFPSLRVSLFCGEALPAALARRWQRAAPNSIVENLYGPTEATIAITAYRVPPPGGSATVCPVVPIGIPFPGQEALIIDRDGRALPDGEAGELCVGGTQVADGYWRLPEVTARRFFSSCAHGRSARWYRTGDRARKDASGNLAFLGRIDHQVKIRGYRIELQEVEAAVREVVGNDGVAALAWPPNESVLAQSIIVFVTQGSAFAEAIIAHCQRKLPPIAVPKTVLFLSEWPLNANGKTDRAALKEMARQQVC